MKQLVLLRKGTSEGGDNQQTINTPPLSILIADARGNYRSAPMHGAVTTFPLLPAAAVAAGTERLMVAIGTGTEVIARSTKGGVNVKTQASTPADNDNALLAAVATTAFVAPISAVSQIRFGAQVSLTQITQLVFGAGMDENLTSPVGSATAGDGAQFLFDPTDEFSTGGEVANWILATKVNGTDAYIDSGVPVVAGQVYDLVIQIGADLKANYYLDGVLVGTSASALTSGDSMGAVIGVQCAGTPDTQKDFDIRYVSVERFPG